MNALISLTSYIPEWLTTFKQTTVKQSTYDRLLISVKALEGFEIADKLIGYWHLERIASCRKERTSLL